MTAAELIKRLEGFPPDAEVYVCNTGTNWADFGPDDITELVGVTASEDAPGKEVYLEF